MRAGHTARNVRTAGQRVHDFNVLLEQGLRDLKPAVALRIGSGLRVGRNADRYQRTDSGRRVGVRADH